MANGLGWLFLGVLVAMAAPGWLMSGGRIAALPWRWRSRLSGFLPFCHFRLISRSNTY